MPKVIKRFVFFFLLFTNGYTYAQIVNIESLRMEQDSLGFTGREQLSFSLVQNTQRLLLFNNNLALQYRRQKNLFLLVNSLSYSLSEDESFERNGYYHLRHNYILSERWSTELFGQYQVNLPLRIKARYLLGTGVRYSLFKNSRGKLALGSSVMYEYDAELNNERLNRAVRGNFYLSLLLNKKDRYAFSSIVYYQPDLLYWTDFRFNGELRFAFDLWKSLQFVVVAVGNYDAFPVVDADIPRLTYKLTNGLSYSF